MSDDSNQQSRYAAGGPVISLLHSFKQLLATLLSMAHTRLELLATELQADITRMGGTLLWAFAALIALGIGCFLAALTLIFIFWDTHRVLVSVIVTAVFFGFALFAFLIIAKRMHDHPRLLQATLAELQSDQEALRVRQ